MIKTFTENDLIRFVYNELSTVEQAQIENSAVQDAAVEESLKELEDTRDSLNELVVSPPQKCIDHILTFSRNFEATGVSE